MNRKNWIRTLIVANLLALSAANGATTVASQEYAVLSLIGDNLTVAQFSTTTGTIVNKTPRILVPVKTPILDDVALLAVEDVVKKTEAGVQLDLLSSSDPVLYKFQNDLFGNTDESATVKAALRAVLKNTTADRLILVSKHRADAYFRLIGSQIGEGKLEGLGYYIDNTVSIRMVDSGATGVGFLAPFAYVKVSLLNARTLQILHTKSFTESEVIANAGSAEAHLSALASTPSAKEN
jgi:hypothetical protein